MRNSNFNISCNMHIYMDTNICLEKKGFQCTTLLADDVDDELAVDEPRDEALCCRCPLPLGGLDPSNYFKTKFM